MCKILSRIIVTCGRNCTLEIDEGDSPRPDKYKKLIRQLITRYVDDMDELGDIDAAHSVSLYTRDAGNGQNLGNAAS